MKDHKRLLQATICHTHKKEQPDRNGRIIRNIQPSKTEPGRDRKYEQTNNKHGN